MKEKIIIFLVVSLMLSGCFSNSSLELNRDEIEVVPTEIEHDYLSNLDILKVRNSILNEDEKFDPNKHECYGIYLQNIIEGEMDNYTITFYCHECETNEDYNTKNVRMSTYFENYVAYSCEYKKWK